MYVMECKRKRNPIHYQCNALPIECITNGMHACRAPKTAKTAPFWAWIPFPPPVIVGLSTHAYLLCRCVYTFSICCVEKLYLTLCVEKLRERVCVEKLMGTQSVPFILHTVYRSSYTQCTLHVYRYAFGLCVAVVRYLRGFAVCTCSVFTQASSVCLSFLVCLICARSFLVCLFLRNLRALSRVWARSRRAIAQLL